MAKNNSATSGKNKDKILASLDRLSAGGSTAGGQGLRKAYDIAEKYFIKNGNNRIILATDGDFNVGTSATGDLVDLIEKKPNGILKVLDEELRMPKSSDKTFIDKLHQELSEHSLNQCAGRIETCRT